MAIEKVELKDALNALVTNTNIDKVTGVLGGVPSNIAKADLASVIAGLMGEPVGTKADLAGGEDLNNVVKSGLYATMSNPNQPSGYEAWYGLLSVSKFRTGEVIQTWTPNGVSSNGMFTRKKEYNSNTWSSWQRLDNFGYNTLADLSSAVAGQMGYKKTNLPKADRHEWYKIIDIGTNSATILQIALFTYYNLSPCFFTILSSSHNNQGSIQCSYHGDLGSSDYSPDLKYKIMGDGSISVWAKIANYSNRGGIYCLGGESISYPMIKEDPPTDAIRPRNS